MEERNHETLQKAIRELRSYAPPEKVWDEISMTLKREEQELQLQETIEQLPTYSPPASIWLEIEKELEQPKATKSRLRYLTPRRIAAAAAVLLLLAIGLPMLLTKSDTGSIRYIYAEEEVVPAKQERDWNKDEADFKKVLASFSQSTMAKSSEQYNHLLSEYQELDEAKKQLNQILDSYGSDPGIIKQISEVERDRSRVIKKMAAFI